MIKTILVTPTAISCTESRAAQYFSPDEQSFQAPKHIKDISLLCFLYYLHVIAQFRITAFS